MNRIKRFVKVLAFVNSADDFGMQPQVVNGGSNLIAGLFGEEARTSGAFCHWNQRPSGGNRL